MQRNIFLALLVFFIVFAGVLFLRGRGSGTAPQMGATMPASTTTATTASTTSDGTITFVRLPGLGLAITPEQAPKSYIPPCAEGFRYCLYYDGTAYQATNFESAGLSITTRPDLSTEHACLMTPPMAYGSSLPPVMNTMSGYATSVFAPVGVAAMGHYASGAAYRLWVSGRAVCYAFDTRVSEAAFANYPAGSVKEFTATAHEQLAQLLGEELNTVTLFASSAPVSVTFPVPPAKG